ncbi:copper amine oxidase N-terminal domain-containing protein [Paenibacillus sp. YYML68]|uniref:copper amine oxidase N-terminal domain-containing protein n=1 Tax=Paenibacillus sp. YYML68 TaxID=2909250 RepID=UPI00249004A1|nr:copper amine oxidase N-terminal domain-containing protein [Paenibacillus sp. YYML68]
MKKIATLVLAASIAASSVGAVSASAATLGQTEFKLSADTSVQIGQVKAYTELLALFTAEKVDLAKVKASYEASFKEAVKARSTDIDAQVSAIIDAGIAGTYSAAQVKQAVDKGLQWYFFAEIAFLTKTDAAEALKKGDKAAAKASLEKAIELTAGTVGVTAGKRDTDYKTLTQNVLNTIAIPGLIKAVEAGDMTEYQVYRQIFEKTIMKVFVMGTVKYAGKVEESLAAGKLDDAKVQQVEGYFFYMPIYGSMTGGSKVAADAIKDAFGSDGKALSTKTVGLQLADTINVKINGYVNRIFDESLPKGDIAKALEQAAEAGAFVSSLETIAKAELGDEAFASLEQTTQLFFMELKDGKYDSAKKHAYDMLKKLAQLKGVSFKVGDKAITVDGKEQTTDTATSYVDANSGRTVASVRFVAEALGADVKFDDATQVVTVTRGSNVLKLQVGSTAIELNGKVSDKKLDQAVVINDGRAYIPVRAAAETLGSKVFWFDGSVIIN